MILDGNLAARVVDIEIISPSLKRFRFAPEGRCEFPTAAPGAHILITLRGKDRVWKNSYSLVTAPDQRETLCDRRSARAGFARRVALSARCHGERREGRNQPPGKPVSDRVARAQTRPDQRRDRPDPVSLLLAGTAVPLGGVRASSVLLGGGGLRFPRPSRRQRRERQGAWITVAAFAHGDPLESAARDTRLHLRPGRADERRHANGARARLAGERDPPGELWCRERRAALRGLAGAIPENDPGRRDAVPAGGVGRCRDTSAMSLPRRRLRGLSPARR